MEGVVRKPRVEFSVLSPHLLGIYFRETLLPRVTLSNGRDTEDDYSLDCLIAARRKTVRARARANDQISVFFFFPLNCQYTLRAEFLSGCDQGLKCRKISSVCS